MNLGSIIRNIRKAKRQTQAEFASLCGITQTYLSQIESNGKEPNLSTLKIISEQLGVSLPILFFLSLDENDISPEKKEIFDKISPSVKTLIDDIFPI